MDIDKHLDEKTLVLLLQQCEAEITKLQSQLQRQQEFKAFIEPKLAIVRSLRAPVARIPKELLSMVFFELVRDDPKAIGPALLVCRHWNNVACNSSMLWPSTTASFTSVIPDIVKQASFLKAAIRYSGNVPLHVKLKFPSLVDFWARLGRRILAPPSDYRAEWIEDRRKVQLDDRDNVVSWLTSAHARASIPLPALKYVDSIVYKEMSSIARTIGNQPSRLHSLALRFDAREFSSWLFGGGFKLFSKPTPMLTELSIIDNSTDNHPSPGNHGNLFPNTVPSLVRLSWKVNWPVTAVITPSGRLHHLRLWLSQDLSNFPPNNYTSNITHLFLDFTSSRWDGEPFLLPRLVDLTLTEPLSLNFFQAPCLITLRLLSHRVTYFTLCDSSIFPSLKRLHFRPRAYLGDVDAHFNSLPHLTEVAFLYQGLEEMTASDIATVIRERHIPLKAYRFIIGDRWNIDFNSYERNEIPVDFDLLCS